VCRIPVDIAGLRAAWIGYAENSAGRSVQVMAIAGHYDESMKALPVNWSEDDAWGAGPAGQALRSGQAQVARDVASEARLSHFHARAQALGYASALAAPFSHHDVRGVLVIYSEDRDAFGPKEVALFQETADDLAFAIHTVRARLAQKTMAEQLHRAAHYDSLTGLCSLLRLEQLLEALIAEAERSTRPFALLVVEVDKFGEMVGVLGHHAGDALLKQVARRLAGHFEGSAEVARVGGERFAVLLPNADGHRASAAALEVADLMNEDFHVDGLPVFASATAGVALYPAHGDSSPALLRCAADAIQGARQSHAPFALYRAGSEQRSTQRLTLAADLRAALDRDELSLHCQPKVDVATRRPCGAEALARWQHPARGPVSPAQFIPIAEHTGLIRPLTYWAIAAVARQVHSLRRAGIGWPLAVNLSARNLHDPQLGERLTASLATWNLQASDLELEITESALMEEPELARQTLLHLREAGYSLYVDDYGTGYSSLAYLKRLPLDAIKIDRSLLKGIDGDRDALLIVRSTIHMAHDLGLKVVAEGVEDETTLARLAELGCDTAQGYLFARPMPLEELLAWAKTAA
jgi:diguanylate cyclase (GGDEF)-like protein